MLKECIAMLTEGRDLAEDQAHEAMRAIMSGQATDAQIAGFLIALRIKGETVAEIAGCAQAMREAATRIHVEDLDVVDTCGTGGTGIATFNVSTAAALVAAGAGVPVAKHGNRSSTRPSGSADVLQELGVNVEAGPQVVERCVREAGIGFLFAPALHKAMRHAIGPRRELGVKTIFNILGPLTNPAGARRQVLGVFSPTLVEQIAGVLKALGSVRAMVVHSDDGLDEISISDRTLAARVDAGTVEVLAMEPEEFGFRRARREEIAVSSVAESAAVVRAVLAGEKGVARDIVLLNAGAAVYVGGRAETMGEGIEAAGESVDSGRAREALERLVRLSNEPA
jgi:anthranilate phosphoribosyltransferase